MRPKAEASGIFIIYGLFSELGRETNYSIVIILGSYLAHHNFVTCTLLL
jgi:hypothetical protein